MSHSLATVVPLTMLAVLFLLLQPEIDATAQTHAPKIHSARELTTFAAKLNRQMQGVEKFIHQQKTKEANLKQAYRKYSARTARHGWNSRQNQRADAARIQREAIKLRALSERFNQQFRNQFAKQVNFVQNEGRRYAGRNEEIPVQVTRTVNMYNRLVELLVNLITCPRDIINELYGDDMMFEETTTLQPSESEDSDQNNPDEEDGENGEDASSDTVPYGSDYK
ncbi:uncharacterized protein LOC131427073 [Malaya genurostris]|uniref:uncharacterized protein LOC131427073 n=1 Tax=Malaya genurostris TaxID=325434 RepID=UPI0026F37E61|nr:uncharacterized protein LOC131427073 [Malaya genurostris]